MSPCQRCHFGKDPGVHIGIGKALRSVYQTGYVQGLAVNTFQGPGLKRAYYARQRSSPVQSCTCNHLLNTSNLFLHNPPPPVKSSCPPHYKTSLLPSHYKAIPPAATRLGYAVKAGGVLLLFVNTESDTGTTYLQQVPAVSTGSVLEAASSK